MMSIKPVCVPCERFMRPLKNGYIFVEGMPTEPSYREGRENNVGKGATGWLPYKVWHGDLWHCPTCGAQIIAGVGREPEAVQHEEHFAESLRHVNGILVKDC